MCEQNQGIREIRESAAVKCALQIVDFLRSGVMATSATIMRWVWNRLKRLLRPLTVGWMSDGRLNIQLRRPRWSRDTIYITI